MLLWPQTINPRVPEWAVTAGCCQTKPRSPHLSCLPKSSTNYKQKRRRTRAKSKDCFSSRRGNIAPVIEAGQTKKNRLSSCSGFLWKHSVFKWNSKRVAVDLLSKLTRAMSHVLFVYAFVRCRELTPIEEASRLNQKLKANYEARLARLTPGQAYQKTSLVSLGNELVSVCCHIRYFVVLVWAQVYLKM